MKAKVKGEIRVERERRKGGRGRRSEYEGNKREGLEKERRSSERERESGREREIERKKRAKGGMEVSERPIAVGRKENA